MEIYSHIINGEKTSSRAKYIVWDCTFSDCPLKKKGYCILKNSDIDCPYGTIHKVMGVPGNNKLFIRNDENFRRDHKNTLDAVFKRYEKLCYIGDFVYAPVCFLRDNNNLEKEHYTVLSVILKISTFTKENIINNILEYRPVDLMNDVPIKSYTEEELPKFMRQMNDIDHELYLSIINSSGKYYDLYGHISNIGRIANLRTLNSSVGYFVDNMNYRWTWDGKTLKSNKNSFFSFKGTNEYVSSNEIMVVPSGKIIPVMITDERQVNENTEFLN